MVPSWCGSTALRVWAMGGVCLVVIRLGARLAFRARRLRMLSVLQHSRAVPQDGEGESAPKSHAPSCDPSWPQPCSTWLLPHHLQLWHQCSAHPHGVIAFGPVLTEHGLSGRIRFSPDSVKIPGLLSLGCVSEALVFPDSPPFSSAPHQIVAS